MKSQISALFAVLDKLPPDEVVKEVNIAQHYTTMSTVRGHRSIVAVEPIEVSVTTLDQADEKHIVQRTYLVDTDGQPHLDYECDA